ncbi:TetR/AcrR family transcriptional regulator [Alkalicoccobacillus porphyridii]|uniref:TetR/AcrR family transcriptional regulator n=1 Tax=Alkalicoccobacillus porphyridii TaxID=2597270 RepID=A0A553ZWP7_9BACI|nr:TetR/AcrR family transcriptional regulator [Alkalicoccobacillus porphyridii]TSB45888.1 TetR/AcrR family transcriptional regulator [Alkalicoccobacillus porphyridii]
MSTKKEIQNISVELFANLGYTGTSISQIVKKVGIKKASFYSHYENKESLLMDVVYIMTSEHLIYVRQTLEERIRGDIESKLYHCFLKFIQDSLDDTPANKLFNQVTLNPPLENKGEIHEIINACSNEVDQMFSEVIREGQKKENITTDFTAEDIVYNYFSLIEGVSLSQKFYSQDIGQIEKAWKIFWRGIKENS